MLDLLARAFGAFVVLYTLFWVAWLWLHIDALVFAVFTKDKKFKPTPPPCELRSRLSMMTLYLILS